MWVRCRSRSLKTSPIDRSYTTYYWSSIVTIALYLAPFSSYGIWRWIIAWLWSLRLGSLKVIGNAIPFDRSHSCSYSTSIATMAVCFAVIEIFSVEYCHDLETWVRRRSRSLKISPIDRSYTTYFYSSIVTIVLSRTVFELFDVE